MVGIDIIEISRVEKSAKNESFFRGVFTAEEIDFYKNKGEKAESLAGMFAAKEAAAKAVGSGFSGFRPIDIEVCHTQYGAPYLKFNRNAAEIFKNFDANLSIAHCGDIATAICILTKR